MSTPKEKKKPAKRVAQGGAVERIVLSVAKADYEDDRDGASFMVPEQRQMARKLCKAGLLKSVTDTRDEVIAVLTAKGLKLIEARVAALPARRQSRPPASGVPHSLQLEADQLVENVRKARVAYSDAYEAFRAAKREGPQSRIDTEGKALGAASLAFATAELTLEGWKVKHAWALTA